MSVLLTHACNDLRQAFNEAVEDGQPVDRHVALQLAECEDIMPRLLCDELALEQGATYAEGVKTVLAA